MTDHIKRLSGEKLKLEKRLLEEERHAKMQEEKLRKLESSLAKRGIKLDETVPKSPPAQDHERSLEID
jgi:ribosomal protein S12